MIAWWQRPCWDVLPQTLLLETDRGVPLSVGEWGLSRGEPTGGEEPKARGSFQEGGCKESRSSSRAAPLRFASAGSAEAGAPGAAGISARFRDSTCI